MQQYGSGIYNALGNFPVRIPAKTLVIRGFLQPLLANSRITDYFNYRGADKSLARLGRKQATATEDFVFHVSYL
jgi:hypothetical protein